MVEDAAVQGNGDSTAALSSKDVYHLVSDAHGGMEPEWDEADAAYYMRFTGSKEALGTKYRLEKVSEEEDPKVGLMTPFKVINSESKRGLSYKAAGNDGYFLVEAEDAPHVFHLEKADDSLACEAYYLVHGPCAGGAGPLAAPEDGATYIKADPARSHGDLPLFLTKVACSAETKV